MGDWSGVPSSSRDRVTVKVDEDGYVRTARPTIPGPIEHHSNIYSVNINGSADESEPDLPVHSIWRSFDEQSILLGYLYATVSEGDFPDSYKKTLNFLNDQLVKMDMGSGRILKGEEVIGQLMQSYRFEPKGVQKGTLRSVGNPYVEFFPDLRVNVDLGTIRLLPNEHAADRSNQDKDEIIGVQDWDGSRRTVAGAKPMKQRDFNMPTDADIGNRFVGVKFTDLDTNRLVAYEFYTIQYGETRRIVSPVQLSTKSSLTMNRQNGHVFLDGRRIGQLIQGYKFVEQKSGSEKAVAEGKPYVALTYANFEIDLVRQTLKIVPSDEIAGK